MDKELRQTLDFYKLTTETEPLRRVFVQGTLFQCVIEGYFHQAPVCHTRRPIVEFSNKARLNLFKFQNTIDWTRIGRSQFLTFTYPDEVLPRTHKQLNVDRYLIHRSIENIKGRRIAVMWRKEYVTRQTGIHIGTLQPHWHLIAFDVGFFPYKDLRVAWKKHLHVQNEPDMDFEEIDCGEKAGYYIAKYTAKPHEPYRLGNIPNLNKIGRHYGMMRRELIPRCRRRFYGQMTHEQAHIITREARKVLDKLYDARPMSFALFGKKMHAVLKVFAEFGLTEAPTPA
jgi:hypothetical protein